MSKIITKIDQNYYFGKILINKNNIFGMTSMSFGCVNLKPIVTGHVLIMPKRIVERVSGLECNELSDLWYLAQQTSIMLEKQHNSPSITFAIQDGIYAGQTINHVHIHVIPRFPNDFQENDQIYSELEKINNSKHVKSLQIESENRQIKTEQQMNDEASLYRQMFDS